MVTDSQLARNLSFALDNLDPKLFLQTPARFSIARARALQLAAIRECFEETGWVIGAGKPGWYRGANPSWAAFSRIGGLPRFDRLQFIARAITPPGRVRRFDARFFLADRAECLNIPPSPLTDELQDLGWYNFAEIESLPLADITRALVDDIHQLLQEPKASQQSHKKPFYFARHNQHIKILL